MQKITLFALLFLFFGKNTSAQPFIDSAFSIQKTELVYGSAVDFAGSNRELKLDLAVPVGDNPPVCGRPLFIAIHGGAFIGGTRKDAVEQFWLEDFAERGYVAASIEYRLGMFQTEKEVHCNVTQLFSTPWDCLNAQDTSEWARAHFRAVQDVRGAIRFLINNKNTYKIDPQNVFIAGESAGGFIALGVGFMDEIAEKAPDCGPIAPAKKPNPIYESPCVQGFGLAPKIDSMQLARPDLGSLDGPLNLPSEPFRIRAVANFFGAMVKDLFAAQKPGPMPALYLFHQPNDLIVPMDKGHVFDGYVSFFTGFPFNCGYIINRPALFGSKGIADLIAVRAAAGLPVPELKTTFTQNFADAWAQITNPTLGGHGIDNYTLRTSEILEFFASKMGACVSSTGEKSRIDEPRIFPNPTVDGRFFVEILGENQLFSIETLDVAGRRVFFKNDFLGEKKVEITLPDGCAAGLFFVKTRTASGMFLSKILND